MSQSQAKSIPFLNSSVTINNLCKYYEGFITVDGTTDGTVTLPFDWTGGIVTAYGSTNTAQFANTAETFLRQATYESLTNAAYTSGNGSFMNSNASNVGVWAKTDDYRVVIKSATPTTITFNSVSGVTQYIKYYVMAPFNLTITGVPVNYNLAGSGAPTITPVFNGQKYLDLIKGSEWTAFGTTSSANWKETYFPPSYIRRTNGLTRGSTNTYVIIYGTSQDSAGSDITYVNSATNGDSFTINTSGVYAISAYPLLVTAGSVACIQVADAVANTLGGSTGRATITSSGANENLSLGWTGYIPAGKVVYIGTNSSLYNDATINSVSIARLR